MKRETRERIKGVRASIERAIEPLGFKRTTDGILRKHSEDIIFTIGLPHVARPFLNTVEIGANLGIWCVPIEAKCAEITGRRRAVRENATVVEPLYGLAKKKGPSYWEFIEGGTPFDVVAADIAEAVRKHGLQWFLERGTLRELVLHREEQEGLPGIGHEVLKSELHKLLETHSPLEKSAP